MRKSIGLWGVCLVVLAALLIVAPSATAGGSSEKTTGNVTLTWAGWDPISKYQPLIDQYAKNKPSVTIQYTSYPDYKTKMLTSAASGTLPDILGIGTGYVLDFGAAGILKEVGPALKDDPSYDFNDIWPSALPFITYNGKIYAAPSDGGTYAMVYNKKMFDAAGVPYPTDKWTWADFLAAAKKLTITQGGKTRYATFVLANGFDGMYGYVRQNGGDIFNADHTKSMLDQPAAWQAMQWVKDLDTKYHVAPPIESTSNIPLPIASMINSGTIAMGRVGMWETHVLKDSDILDWAATPMPAGVAGHSEILYLNGLGVAASSKVGNDAVDFLKFATSKTGEEILLRHTSDPQIAVRKSLKEVAISSFEAKRNAGAWIDAMAYSQYYPLIPKLSEVIGVADREMSKALIEGQPAQQVFATIAADQNAVLSGQ